MNHFADRLAEAIHDKGCAVCVGIDPRISQLPSEFHPAKDTPRAFAESVAKWAEELLDVVAAPLVQHVGQEFEEVGIVESSLDLLDLFFGERVEDVIAQ